MKAAEQGDPKSQTDLGFLYANGKGILKDDTKAVEWYQKAASQGFAEAQCNLGFMYAGGRGVLRDDAKAAELFEKAATQGNAEAQCNLGVAYANGQGIPKSDTKAVEWYQKAASLGNAVAQYNLAIIYRDGTGVSIDSARAAELFERAATQGFPRAQFDLGVLYADGKGLPRDDSKAVDWYLKAAYRGLAQAQYNVGFMYGVGRGVPLNTVRSYAWILLSAAQNEPLGVKARDTIASHLTAEQMAEAQKLASELFEAMPKREAERLQTDLTETNNRLSKIEGEHDAMREPGVVAADSTSQGKGVFDLKAEKLMNFYGVPLGVRDNKAGKQFTDVIFVKRSDIDSSKMVIFATIFDERCLTINYFKEDDLGRSVPFSNTEIEREFLICSGVAKHKWKETSNMEWSLGDDHDAPGALYAHLHKPEFLTIGTWKLFRILREGGKAKTRQDK